MNVKTLKINGNQGFSILNGINRAIIPAQVTKLANSIQRMGIIRPVVVAKLPFYSGSTTEQFMVDGQHLYHGCLRLGIDVPYVEITIENDEDLVETLALLNSSSKSWTLADYILSWKHVRSEYHKLNKYANIYDLELSQIAQLLHYGTISIMGSSVTTVIKNGTFCIKNEGLCLQILDNITDVLKVIPRMDRMSNKAFISQYVSFFKQFQDKYDHTEFVKYLIKNKDQFALATQSPDEFQKLFIKAI